MLGTELPVDSSCSWIVYQRIRNDLYEFGIVFFSPGLVVVDVEWAVGIQYSIGSGPPEAWQRMSLGVCR